MKFITSTLMLLEDAGLLLNRPHITTIELHEDGKRSETAYYTALSGRRVTIESNHHAKFLLLFAMLDFYIDTKHPSLEGNSYFFKYKHLPEDNDFHLIFKELFRIAKLIRNTLVHSSSNFIFQDKKLNINYNFKRITYSLRIPTISLDDLYTLIVMFIERDNVNSEYFIRLSRYIYRELINNIELFSDEISCNLKQPREALTLLPYQRYRVPNAKYEVNDTVFKITESKNIKKHIQPHQSYDFCVLLNNVNYIIPLEVLDDDLSIPISALNLWEKQGY